MPQIKVNLADIADDVYATQEAADIALRAKGLVPDPKPVK
jgi:hypothetical protein